MPAALLHAVLLILLVVAIRLLPLPVVGALVVLPVVLHGVLSNRTRAHRVAGSSVLVTGASSGLGRALALEAARRGAARLHLVARTPAALEETAAQIRALAPSCEARVHPCDVTRQEAVATLVDHIVQTDGPPDIVVNNAGSGAWKHLEETSGEEAVAMMACPSMAAIYMTTAVVPEMAKRGRGHVMNVTSAASLQGFRGAVVYGTARWAVRGFSLFSRADLAELGIGVTLLNAAEVADTAYFSDAEGKAGSSSHAKIPWLFQLPMVGWMSYDSSETSKAAWAAVESGEYEALVPVWLVAPMALIGRVLPGFLHALLRLGPNGRRGTP